MKSPSDATTTPDGGDPAVRGEIDEMLKRWPEVAAPSGGYEGLAARAAERVDEDREARDSSDAMATPQLPPVEGEPSEGHGNGHGPKLETLAALARESVAPARRDVRSSKAPETKDTRSGVINLRAMIAESSAQPESGKLADALEKDGAPAVAVASLPLATTQPSTVLPTPAVRPAAPEKRSSTWMVLVAIVAVAGIGGYVVLERERRADEREATRVAEREGEAATGVAVADEPADEPAARRVEAQEQAPVTGSAPAEGAAGAEDQSRTTAASTAERRATRPAAAGGAARERPESSASPAQAPAAPPPPAAPTPTEPAPAKRAAQADLDALISGAAGTRPGDPSAPAATAAPTAAPEGALPQPNRQQIQRGMGRVSGAVRACANGQAGMVMLRITFVSDGSVSNASVASGPFAGTGAASCMENAARSARVPAFTNPSVTVSYPVMVQPPDPNAAPAAP